MLESKNKITYKIYSHIAYSNIFFLNIYTYILKLLLGIHLNLIHLFDTYQIIFYVLQYQMHQILNDTNNTKVMYHEVCDFYTMLKYK